MREEHLAGKHADVIRIACVLCVREAGGAIKNVEILASRPDEVRRKP